MYTKTNTIFLFDVDGTLTPSRCKASPEIINMLQKLKEKVKIGFVGGSDLNKQIEQVGPNLLEIFDYGFPENGLSFYKNKNLVCQEKIIDYMKEELYSKFVNFCLCYLSKLELPKKRGTFIEYRDSMINISPIGRNCSPQERAEFFALDKEHKYRLKMVEALKQEFSQYNMDFVIGGQISIDCFPKGWDKRYCLKHIKAENIEHIIFFGDMTQPGGNDYEIFRHAEVMGNTVNDPADTITKVNMCLQQCGMDKL